MKRTFSLIFMHCIYSHVEQCPRSWETIKMEQFCWINKVEVDCEASGWWRPIWWLIVLWLHRTYSYSRVRIPSQIFQLLGKLITICYFIKFASCIGSHRKQFSEYYCCDVGITIDGTSHGNNIWRNNIRLQAGGKLLSKSLLRNLMWNQ